jgi:hypothetical protein
LQNVGIKQCQLALSCSRGLSRRTAKSQRPLWRPLRHGARLLPVAALRWRRRVNGSSVKRRRWAACQSSGPRRRHGPLSGPTRHRFRLRQTGVLSTGSTIQRYQPAGPDHAQREALHSVRRPRGSVRPLPWRRTSSRPQRRHGAESIALVAWVHDHSPRHAVLSRAVSPLPARRHAGGRSTTEAERIRPSSGRNHRNPVRVLVSYRTLSHARGFRPVEPPPTLPEMAARAELCCDPALSLVALSR